MGSPFGFITPSRGLHQGDPLSLFLFVVGMEILSHLLDKAHSLSLVNEIRLNRGGPSITHLLYADDLLIFGQANPTEARNINFCLQLFSQWSGQSPNAAKSSIFITPNTSHSCARAVHEFLVLN